jgi:hypothetical protein
VQPGFFSEIAGLGYVLEIALRDGGRVLRRVPVATGGEILFAYIHSADGTPVEQLFRAGEDGSLHLLEERYRWYGGGLEFGSGLTFSYEGGVVRVSGYDRSFEFLPLMSAWTVPQEFIIGETRILLSDLVPGGTPLVIRLAPAAHLGGPVPGAFRP